MSGAPPFPGPDREAAEAIVGRYPADRRESAVLPLLDLAQRRAGGWLPPAALDAVADYVGMTRMRIREVASFYTMLRTEPTGRRLVQVCRTTPCWLRGSDRVLEACRDELGVGPGGTTADGAFTLVEVECLGACVNAPVVQIGDDYHEDLDAERMRAVLRGLRGEA